MLDLDKCVRYDAGTFVGYLIGIVPSDEDSIPIELSSFNNLTNYLDDEDKLKMSEKRRIVDMFGGRIDRFTMASCETASKYKYTRYIYVVGEFSDELHDDMLSDLMYLVGSGFPFMVKYSEIPANSIATLDQYFNLAVCDNETFGLMSLKNTWWLSCVRSLVWPIHLVYRIWSWFSED